MSDDQSARLGLPYLAAGQMQKHVTLNEALTRLDALVQTTVASRTTATQPAAPEDGRLHIIPNDAEGAAWSGFGAGDLVRAETDAWTVVEAPDGLLAWVEDEGVFVVRDGGDWIPLGAALGQIGPVDRLGLGTATDAANPFAAKLNKALWTALETGAGGDGDLRLTLNKETSTDVLSLLFQSGYGGRAELGLIGDDDLSLKVSADGAAWQSALSVDRATGRVSFPRGAGRLQTTVMSASGSWTPPAWARTVEAVVVSGGGGGGAGAFGSSGDRFGGGGGGAGGVSRATWSADLLTDGLTVVVGTGGMGGATGAGADGGVSSVALGATRLTSAPGGVGGRAGSAGGAGGAAVFEANGGGSSKATTTGGSGETFTRPYASGGGGGGGALTAGGTARNGGPGGDGGAYAVAAAGGSAGSAGSAAPLSDLHWAGGGGGGGAAVASGAGHPGGDGGASGGGGGGGGAGVTVGGAGGDGASGVVRLTAWG